MHEAVFHTKIVKKIVLKGYIIPEAEEHDIINMIDKGKEAYEAFKVFHQW